MVNQWYAIELYADFAAGTNHVWVDGNQLGINIPIPAGNISSAGFEFNRPRPDLGKIEVDDIDFGAAPIISAVSANGFTDGSATISWRPTFPRHAGGVWNLHPLWFFHSPLPPVMTKDHAIGATG